MSESAKIKIESDDAELLADLVGIQYDLDSVIRLAKLFLADLQREAFRSEVVDAFTTAILVRYSRPFATGVRKRLEAGSATILSEEERQLHERCLLPRDKHVAHSVNAFEENELFAVYSPETVHEKGIESIVVEHHRVAGPLSKVDLNGIIRIATKFLEYVQQKIESERAKVLKLVSQIPIEKLLKSEGKSPYIVDMARIDRSRKKQRLSTSGSS